MAANNLRIVYDNQVDYSATTVTASSTASTSLLASNLTSDVRGLIWRSITHNPTFSVPAVFKNVGAVGTGGRHSNLTVTSSPSSGGATLYYTWTPNGGTETANTTNISVPLTTAIGDLDGRTSYVYRLYNNTTTAGSTLLDRQTVPVVLNVANTITVVLTNDFHRLPGSPTPVMSGSGTIIQVYDGLTPMRYDATGSNQGTYRVTAIGTGASVGSISGSINAYASMGDHVTTTSVTSTVTYTVAGKNYSGTAVTSSAVQTLVQTVVAGSVYHTTTFDSSINRAILQLNGIPTSASAAGLVALNCCNLGEGSVMRAWGYTGTVSTITTGTGIVELPHFSTAITRNFDTGHLICQPFASKAQDTWITTGYGTVTYGLDKQLARIYIPPATQRTATSVLVEVVDFQPTVSYIEASRLIVGRYWSPTYNTDYGLGVSMVDTSETNRSEAGDLITTMGVVYKTMNFDLNWLTKTDRDELVKLLRQRGKRRPLFVSLFPENADDWEKESLYQLYCKLSDSVPINHPYLEFFSSSIQLEEV